VHAPPGWYRDPTDPLAQRWWDGTAWTVAARRGAGAPVPRRRGRDAAAVGTLLVVAGALVMLVALTRHGVDLRARDASGFDAVGGARDAGGRADAGMRAEVPTDGADFVESTGAYSLRTGTGWDPVDIPRGVGWYTGESSRRFRDNVTVLIEDLERPLPLDEYVRLSVAAVERTEMRYGEVTRRGVVLPDGNPATLVDYRSEQGGFSLGHRVVIAVRGRVAVSVTFTTEADRFDVTVRDVAPYLTSVQIR
jgi:hypothetical protein